ncbi:MAG: lytic transglycosylase domain-containing protein [Gemmatimonadales bacterium]|nr:lytic transglycosylase domain-containing protein [Gemmatimonadales bacterium]
MQTNTRRLMLRGGTILLAALLVTTVGGWAGDTADADAGPSSGAEVLGELRALRQQLDAKQGELEVARLQLDRVDAIMQYSTHYRLPADMATAVYDVALSEGIDPGLAFRLVKVESAFNPRAKSHVGALGLTQVLPSTARLYEPGLTTEQLYDRDTNLRIGFRYLRDLLDRYPTRIELALLAYNRGPARVEQLLGAGRDPANGYETAVMKGFRHR